MKRKLSIILVLAMMLSVFPMSSSAASFTDVSSSDWYSDAVSFVTSEGIFSGTSDSAFSPDTNMTRGMLVTVLGRIAGIDSSGISYTVNQFGDISGMYYAHYVNWAASKGIVSGTSTLRFSPDDEVTRQDMVVMIYRYVTVMQGEIAEITPSLVYFFDDYTDISEYAQQAMYWALENGVISGYTANTLNPKGYATRAQVAQLILNCADMLGIDASDVQTEAETDVSDVTYTSDDEAVVEEALAEVAEAINADGGATATESLALVYESLEELVDSGELADVEYDDDGNIVYELLCGVEGVIAVPMYIEDESLTSGASGSAQESLLSYDMYDLDQNTSDLSQITLGDEPLMGKTNTLFLYTASSMIDSGWIPQFDTNTVSEFVSAAKGQGLSVSTALLNIDSLKTMASYGMVLISSPSVIAGGKLYVPQEDFGSKYNDEIALGLMGRTYLLFPTVSSGEVTDQEIYSFTSGLTNYKLGWQNGYQVDMDKFCEYYYSGDKLSETFLHLGYGDSYDDASDIIESTGALGISSFSGEVGTEQAQDIIECIQEVLFENDADEGNSFGDLLPTAVFDGIQEVTRTAYYNNSSAQTVSKEVTTNFIVEYSDEQSGASYQLWKPLSVTFDLNGGYIDGDLFAYFSTFGGYDMTGRTSLTVQVDKGDELGEPNDPESYDDAKFLGWRDYYDTTADFWDFDSDVVTEDMTLVAVWEEEEETTVIYSSGDVDEVISYGDLLIYVTMTAEEVVYRTSYPEQRWSTKLTIMNMGEEDMAVVGQGAGIYSATTYNGVAQDTEFYTYVNFVGSGYSGFSGLAKGSSQTVYNNEIYTKLQGGGYADGASGIVILDATPTRVELSFSYTGDDNYEGRMPITVYLK